MPGSARGSVGAEMSERKRKATGDAGVTGKPSNILCSHDSSASEAVNAVLEECYSIYSQTVDSIEEYVFVTDSQLNLMFVNRSLRRCLEDAGMRLDKLGEDVFRLLPCLPGDSRRQYKRIRQTGLARVSEEVLVLDGEQRIFRTCKMPVKSRGKVTRIVTIMQDLTDQRRLEREILDVSTLERQRIGKDLHDSLGQYLTGISFLIEALRRDLVNHSHPGARSASQIANLSTLALSQARNIVRGLSPLRLTDGGLRGALQAMSANVCSTYGIACDCHIRGVDTIQDEAVSTHLYCIGQEAVHNAVRHGAPSKIAVRLLAARDHIRFTVEDNGRGLPPDWDRRPGLGISTMRYRAAVLGGMLVIEKRKQGGTLVSCRVPIALKQGRKAAPWGVYQPK